MTSSFSALSSLGYFVILPILIKQVGNIMKKLQSEKSNVKQKTVKRAVAKKNSKKSTGVASKQISEENIKTKTSIFQIKIVMAIYKHKKLIFRNEILVPSEFENDADTRIQINKEITHRLKTDYFFRSPNPDYDIVKYADAASVITYMRYFIVEKSL